MGWRGMTFKPGRKGGSMNAGVVYEPAMVLEILWFISQAAFDVIIVMDLK
tara:strand:- start:409 stop:558 length:150 start_codon:yes stop_codon:yes gene_type:complete